MEEKVHVSVVQLVIQFLDFVAMIAVELINEGRVSDFIIPMLPFLINDWATSVLDGFDADFQPHQAGQ